MMFKHATNEPVNYERVHRNDQSTNAVVYGLVLFLKKNITTQKKKSALRLLIQR